MAPLVPPPTPAINLAPLPERATAAGGLLASTLAAAVVLPALWLPEAVALLNCCMAAELVATELVVSVGGRTMPVLADAASDVAGASAVTSVLAAPVTCATCVIWDAAQ